MTKIYKNVKQLKSKHNIQNTTKQLPITNTTLATASGSSAEKIWRTKTHNTTPEKKQKPTELVLAPKKLITKSSDVHMTWYWLFEHPNV